MIKLVVPFPPGGVVDTGARLIGRKLSEQLAQPVVIENKPGAGGNIGSAYVAKSEADGYTMLLGTQGTQVANQFLYKAPGFDAERDLVSVHDVFAVPNVIVTSDMSIRSLEELITRAKAQPGKLAYASPGNGTGSHLTAELFSQITGIQLHHIPYRGSAAAITDVLGGNVPVAFDFAVTTMPHVQTGKLRALAVTSAVRIPALPDVPSVRELGISEAESTSWTGLFVPRNTPVAVVKRLETAMGQVMRDPEVVGSVVKFGAVVTNMGNPRFVDFVRSERVKWQAIVKRSGATLD
ncbi:Bug family tripartite tricarboxylate transporter substrate binding protein [Hydrogenophaga sp. BPS33]|uniref:Bug family tripartite tricarboxylate transporter substrate binding protein n=1 Tax=Hydrogenophaga sp. BPS33 TaxID=2651974 RepID=UPI00135C5BAD|nr:tripartite tricarboxylate transporter substrate binding protein [Hydrogenophaga sp. BPS33]